MFFDAVGSPLTEVPACLGLEIAGSRDGGEASGEVGTRAGVFQGVPGE